MNDKTMSDGKYQAQTNTRLGIVDEKLRDHEQRLRAIERTDTTDITEKVQQAAKRATLEEQVASIRRVGTWVGGVLSAVLAGLITALMAGWLKP